jgi:hypothetical protein
VYSPSKDLQRFCVYCEEWLHEGCLTGPIEVMRRELNDLDNLTQYVPICRGSNGQGRDQQKDWHVAGTGRKIEKAREWADKEVAPNEWRQLLGAGFVDEMIQTQWDCYECPTCLHQI